MMNKISSSEAKVIYFSFISSIQMDNYDLSVDSLSYYCEKVIRFALFLSLSPNANKASKLTLLS